MNLIDTKKKLLLRQKEMIGKLHNLLKNVSSPIEDQIKLNLANILTKNFAKVTDDAERTINASLNKRKLSANTKTVKNTDKVQNVKFKLMNGYFVPLNSITSGLSISSNSNKSNSSSTEIVDLTDS